MECYLKTGAQYTYVKTIQMCPLKFKNKWKKKGQTLNAL